MKLFVPVLFTLVLLGGFVSLAVVWSEAGSKALIFWGPSLLYGIFLNVKYWRLWYVYRSDERQPDV